MLRVYKLNIIVTWSVERVRGNVKYYRIFLLGKFWKKFQKFIRTTTKIFFFLPRRDVNKASK